MFPHLALTDWPFTVVPRKEHCTFVAGRETARADLDNLLRSMARRSASTISVLWSWFGAGKTHSLFYLANSATAMSTDLAPVALLPVYTEFPRKARSFVDLFSAFIRGLGSQILSDAILEVMTSPKGAPIQQDLELEDPDLATAFRSIVMGTSHERATSIRWLRAEALPISQLREVGIAHKLNSSELAIRVFSLVVQILDDAAVLRGKRFGRVIWLIDEFQRVAKAGCSVIDDVNAGLHSVFNALPVGFGIVISFSGPPDRTDLPEWLGPEIRDRIGATKVIILPPLQPQEVHAFLRDVLAHYRDPAAQVSCPLFPFSEAAVNEIIRHIQGQAELRPRTIISVCHAVLEAADEDIQHGSMKEIQPTFVKSALDGFVFLTTDPTD